MIQIIFWLFLVISETFQENKGHYILLQKWHFKLIKNCHLLLIYYISSYVFLRHVLINKTKYVLSKIQETYSIQFNMHYHICRVVSLINFSEFYFIHFFFKYELFYLLRGLIRYLVTYTYSLSNHVFSSFSYFWNVLKEFFGFR